MIRNRKSRRTPRRTHPSGNAKKGGATSEFQNRASRAVPGVLAGIIEQLCVHSVQTPGGSASWPARPERTSTENAVPPTVGPHLYDGTAGIALFLAAYFSVTRDAIARELAIRSIAPLAAKVAQLATDPERAQRLRIPIGGLVGLGSFLYTFTRIAGWLSLESAMDSARAIASLISTDRILTDKKLDVMAGSAGAALALLSFSRADGLQPRESERAVGLAMLCGRRLLEQFTSWGSCRRPRLEAERPAISGFAHGAAGISCALLRLYESTGESEFLNTCLEGFAFERSLYNSDSQTWLDPRSGRPLEQAAWCHGAPGMALARLSCDTASDIAEVRRDVEEALAVTQKLPTLVRDHLCCGNSSLIEILHHAGSILERADLQCAAGARMERVLARAQVAGFCFETDDSQDGQPEAPFDPSLFLGISGVGYTLLRLVHPGCFPCLLLME